MWPESGTKRTLSIVFVILFFGVLGWYGYDALFRGRPADIEYQVLETKEVTSGDPSRGIAEVRIESVHPTIRELKQVAFEVWKSQPVNWDQFTVFIYTPGMVLDEEAYMMAEFGKEGLNNFRVPGEPGES